MTFLRDSVSSSIMSHMCRVRTIFWNVIESTDNARKSVERSSCPPCLEWNSRHAENTAFTGVRVIGLKNLLQTERRQLIYSFGNGAFCGVMKIVVVWLERQWFSYYFSYHFLITLITPFSNIGERTPDVPVGWSGDSIGNSLWTSFFVCQTVCHKPHDCITETVSISSD